VPIRVNTRPASRTDWAWVKATEPNVNLGGKPTSADCSAKGDRLVLSTLSDP
jgi:hypothetical protein